MPSGAADVSAVCRPANWLVEAYPDNAAEVMPPRLLRAATAVVAPVPPLLISSTPVRLNVPLSVIALVGVNDKPDTWLVMAMLVTVPNPDKEAVSSALIRP
jgi:hypothetical protein